MSDEFTAEEQAVIDEMQAEIDQPVEATPPETPSEAEKQPVEAQEAEKQAEPPAEPSKPPEGFVPHQAMHAERMQRQAAEKQLAEMGEKIAQLEKQVNPEPQYVDPIEDPEGFRRWSEHNAQAARSVIDTNAEASREQQRIQQRQNEAAVFEQQFMAQEPAYADAANFLHQQRLQELASQGVVGPDADATISKDINALFDAAKAANMNPAQLIFIRAQEAGFVKQKSPAESIQAQAAAQAATQTVSGQSGAPQAGELTAEIVANMPQAEFDKLSEDQLRAVGL